mgnify:CR=1 FL=1
MQAITLSISQKGIEYLADKIISSAAIKFLDEMSPPDINIAVDAFSPPPDMSGYYIFRTVNIHLSKGQLSRYKAVFEGIKLLKVSSGVGAKFDLCFSIKDFSAHYQWLESYHLFWKMTRSGAHKNQVTDKGERLNRYNFSPLFSSLNINAVLKFSYRPPSQSYELEEDAIVGKANTSRHNIPQDSILQVQPRLCFNDEVKSATTKMIEALGFGTYLCTLFNKTFSSIPRSGRLSEDMIFDFSFANELAGTSLRYQQDDSGDAKGLTLGMSGGMQWVDKTGQAHTYEEAPPNVPNPPIPSDDDIFPVNIYISNYGINASLWAYYKSGRFNATLRPEDLKTPQLLHSNTYENIAPLFHYHRRIDMNFDIQPMEAPTTRFRQVFTFSAETMVLLEKKLPADTFDKLQALSGQTLLDLESLSHVLKDSHLNTQQIAMVKDFSTATGLILSHTINFTITMLDDNTSHHKIDYEIELCACITDFTLSPSSYLLPKLAFSRLEKNAMPEKALHKIKSLQDLTFASKNLLSKAIIERLSETESRTWLENILAYAIYPVQTMNFSIQAIEHTRSKVELVATTIPGFANYRIGALIWQSIGSIKYAKILANIGRAGIPIPTIKNFNFQFESAQLQIEDQYIAIAANIEQS